MLKIMLKIYLSLTDNNQKHLLLKIIMQEKYILGVLFCSWSVLRKSTQMQIYEENTRRSKKLF